MPSIPYARHSLDQADKDAVLRVLDSDRLTQGPEVDAFEKEFGRQVGAPYAVAFSSGTAALHAAAYVANGQDDFITSALTFVASANCGVYVGGALIFADIEPDTWNVSVRTLRAAVSGKKTWSSAIVPVHFAGHPCDIKAIRAGTKLPIIEDACHALGSPGVGSCEYSDFCAFSFHPSKAITTAEGGMVTCRTKANAKALKRFRNHGFQLSKGWYRDQVDLGYNYRMSDVHAALGRSQLPKLPQFIERRREIAQRYYEELKGVKLPPYHDDHAWHLFVIRHPKRNRLYTDLKRRSIETQVHYKPLHLNTFHRGASSRSQFPNAERYVLECLSLPIFPDLTDAEQTKVIKAVNSCVV
jgi:perosamine synthetase